MANHDNSSQYYWYDGKKIILQPSEKKEAIYIIPNRREYFKSTIETIKESTIDDSSTDLGNGLFILNREMTNHFENFTNESMDSNGRKINIFEDDSALMIAQNDFIVQFKEGTTAEQIEAINKEFNATIISTYEWDDKCFLLTVNNVDENEIIKIANEYYEKEIVEFSHPNFITIIQAPSVPNDALFNQQWALLNTGQTGGIPGNDLKITEAWKITQGSPSIIVAIIDDGIDYDHEDLNVSDKLIMGYNALTKTNNNNLGVLDSHGTSCAGIVSASGNNSVGVVGVAPGCKLIGIKIMNKISSSSWKIDAINVADGINTAVQRGADILSNSWFIKPVDVVRKALLNVKQKGRNGKGCVICCAAGNTSGQVVFPATLQEVLTVSACNEFGEFKTLNSKDNEHFWGSCFGKEVDICAPGVHIVTTTKMLNIPNPPLRNYILNFNGTSAATPFVAGVAALILSINSNLSASEVEEIIKSSADNLDQIVPNNNIGFGRVNAFNALLAAQTINL